MAIIISDWASFITAVGTADAEVEFPKNLVKTLDTAVDPNKLYVDANGTVQTNVQASDLANLYENTFVLDANSSDGFPEGLSASIAINCASLKGFGGTIKNLASDSVNIFETKTGTNIDGIAVLNVSCKNCNFMHSTWNGTKGTISHFINSGRCNASTTGDGNYYLFASKMIFSQCAFTVELFNDAKLTYYNFSGGYSIFLYCRFNIIDNRTIETGTGHPEQFAMSNCYFTGNFNKDISISMVTGYIDYTVFDVDGQDIRANNSTTGGYVFVNKDRATIGAYVVGVTTAQLKSAEELASLGFPIQT
jgi:hypothetical protein